MRLPIQDPFGPDPAYAHHDALAVRIQRAWDRAALRAVRILDEWAEKRGTLTPAPRKRPRRLGGGYVVFLVKDGPGYVGDTRDAARISAAQAAIKLDGAQ